MASLQRWEIFTDALLQRAVTHRRRQWKQGFDPLAGSVVDDEHLERLLADLPTFRAVARLDDRLADLDRAVELAREALHDPAAVDPFARLTAAAALDEVECEVVALAAAIGWDPVRLRLLGYVQDDLSVRGPMLAMLPFLLGRDNEALHAASPDGALIRSCLVEIRADALTGSAVLTIPTSVQWFLLGDDSLDPDLPSDAVQHAGPHVAGDAPALVLVHGPDRIRRQEAAATLVGTTRILSTRLPVDDEQWSAVVRTALCSGSAVALEIEEMTPATRRWITRTTSVPWIVSARHPITLVDLPAMHFVEAEADPRPLEDDEVRAALGNVPTGHRLSAEQLDLLARLDGLEAEGAVRRLASGELDRLALRIRPRRHWDDLVLPPERLAQVREVVVRVRHRSTVYEEWGFRAVPSAGVLALFSGPSGTGKTMSAEIIAGELGLDLFKIDLSSLISKYIGETEKNLERIFGAAEGGGVVLVFDEADAVFGKRTQVSDAQDRFANIQTSYLLQRLESYDGLVVLTSNFAGNIDQAFMRRIHVSVEFPLPEEPERRAIWEASFPASAPLGEIDLDFLSKQFKLAGGSIRTAALSAAFAAADRDEPVSMQHVVHGVRREYQKLGKIATASEFGRWLNSALD